MNMEASSLTIRQYLKDQKDILDGADRDQEEKDVKDKTAREHARNSIKTISVLSDRYGGRIKNVLVKNLPFPLYGFFNQGKGSIAIHEGLLKKGEIEKAKGVIDHELIHEKFFGNGAVVCADHVEKHEVVVEKLAAEEGRRPEMFYLDEIKRAQSPNGFLTKIQNTLGIPLEKLLERYKKGDHRFINRIFNKVDKIGYDASKKHAKKNQGGFFSKVKSKLKQFWNFLVNP